MKIELNEKPYKARAWDVRINTGKLLVQACIGKKSLPKICKKYEDDMFGKTGWCMVYSDKLHIRLNKDRSMYVWCDDEFYFYDYVGNSTIQNFCDVWNMFLKEQNRIKKVFNTIK